MTPHDLLANFETLAEAPNGIQRLRELVLELAVRGKLVEQDPKDEPAAEILKRIQVAKAERTSAKKSRNVISLPVGEDERPFEIPQNWVWTRATQLGVVNPRNECLDEDAVAFVPMAVLSTDYRAEIRPELRPWKEIKKGYTHIADGDIAIAKITPCFENGKAAVFEHLPGGYGAGTTELHVLRPIEGTIDPYFVLLFFKSPTFVTGGVATMTGTAGQQRVSGDYFSSRPIPLPPLPEQRRIVARVDELMALLDRLEAKRQEREAARTAARDSALAALREAPTPDDVETAWLRIQERFHELFATPEDVEPLRQAVLFLAGEGRLVPQDPREGSAFDLLNQIERAHQPRTKRGVPRLKNPISSPEPEREPGVLPQGWAWASIEQCCEVVGGIQKTAARRPRNNPYPYLRVANVQRGRFDLSEVAQFELEPDELERWRLEPADLLIVEGNGSEDEIGRCAMWNGQIPNCVHQNHLIRCRAAIPTLAPYILHHLNSPQGISTMKSLAVTTSGLFNLSVGKIRSIRFPMPPEREQHRILQRTGELMRIIDQLKTTLANESQLASAFAAAAVHHLDA